MSAILGIFTSGKPVDQPVMQRMLDGMPGRGSARAELWWEGAAALAVSRHDWELGDGFSGPVLVAREGDLVVAADASLYYRDDLRRKLAGKGVRATADTPSHLILAAYRAWGEKCAEHLEGDFTFIVWDRRERRVFASRDFAGKRPLFYAELGDTLVVASTIGGVLAHPKCSEDLNVVAIADTLAGYYCVADQTSYSAVARLPAGHNLVKQDQHCRSVQYWLPPQINAEGSPPFQRAAEELRELICTAVAERMATHGSTSVQLSGGWDSPAVFGAGERLFLDGRCSNRLKPVSMSYPEGDPGREDELIRDVLDYWENDSVTWLKSYDIPYYSSPADEIEANDGPEQVAFRGWCRAIARASRDAGARVMFTGFGGDQLFSVSQINMADLFRGGRWMSVAREWRAKHMKDQGFRSFLRWTLQPNLPPLALRAARLMRGGRPLRSYLDAAYPTWINGDFAERHDLRGRQQASAPPRGRLSHADYELLYSLQYPYFSLNMAGVFSFGLQEGVEARSPLYDERIVRFAASRPAEERSLGPETKQLLRASMTGLLPPNVLAPRKHRTGVSGLYFRECLHKECAEMLRRVLEAPRTEALGVVDGQVLRQKRDSFLRTGNPALAHELWRALEVELWLQARERGATEELARATKNSTGILAA